jgi:hypothetical protein
LDSNTDPTLLDLSIAERTLSNEFPARSYATYWLARHEQGATAVVLDERLVKGD